MLCVSLVLCSTILVHHSQCITGAVHHRIGTSLAVHNWCSTPYGCTKLGLQGMYILDQSLWGCTFDGLHLRVCTSLMTVPRPSAWQSMCSRQLLWLETHVAHLIGHQLSSRLPSNLYLLDADCQAAADIEQRISITLEWKNKTFNQRTQSQKTFPTFLSR